MKKFRFLSASQRPLELPLSSDARIRSQRARILFRILDLPFQSATKRDQLRPVMMSERGFPGLSIDGSVGIGILGLVDNLDASHDTFHPQDCAERSR